MKIAFENIKEKLKSKQIVAKNSSSVSNLEIKASHYDRVSGYTIKQLESALVGARYWMQ